MGRREETPGRGGERVTLRRTPRTGSSGRRYSWTSLGSALRKTSSTALPYSPRRRRRRRREEGSHRAAAEPPPMPGRGGPGSAPLPSGGRRHPPGGPARRLELRRARWGRRPGRRQPPFCVRPGGLGWAVEGGERGRPFRRRRATVLLSLLLGCLSPRCCW